MIDIVIPTIGRASLGALLGSLGAAAGPLPQRIIIVDDRPPGGRRLDLGPVAPALRERIMVLRAGGRGPAAARNCGWRAARAEWVAFLDDDVLVSPTWLDDATRDVRECAQDVAASTGRVEVPLPVNRRPTDWERNVAGLADARFITADCAYRRIDLEVTGGFDERFPRAYREDADLALRVLERGRRIAQGRRRVTHPVRPASPYVSIALQAGNADDVLMEALHGHDWYERAGASRGAFRRHVWTVGFGALALASATAWSIATLDFARRRIVPGPRTGAEIGAMLVTSAIIPFAAVRHRIAGYFGLPARLAASAVLPHTRPRAVFFDRDGTLVEDVPFNGEPADVRPVAGARDALARLRAAGIPIGIVSNQSGLALGKFTAQQLAAVHARLIELLGPFDTIAVCPHAPHDGCACRKPEPGLIEQAARTLGIAPRDCMVIGDIGADVDAARAAGAGAILVPTPVTKRAEIEAADIVARTLGEAVDLVLDTCV